MRKSSIDVIQELQAMDPSEWLKSPYLRSIESESLRTLLKHKPEGFQILLNSEYERYRDAVLQRSIVKNVLQQRPYYIALLPPHVLSDRLFTQVTNSLEQEQDSFTKQKIEEALHTAQFAFEEYRKHMDTSQSDTKKEQETKQEEKPEVEKQDPPVDEENKPNKPEHSSEQDAKTPSTAVKDAPKTDGELTQSTEVSTSLDAQSTGTIVSSQISTSDATKAPSTVSSVAVSTNTLNHTVESILLETSLQDLKASLTKELTEITQQNQKSLKQYVEAEIAKISANMAAQNQVFKLLQDNLDHPSQTLLTNYAKETEHLTHIMNAINEALVEQCKQLQTYTEEFQGIYKESGEELGTKAKEAMVAKVMETALATVESSAKTTEEKTTQMTEAVIKSCNNSLTALQAQHGNVEAAIKSMGKLFSSQKIYQRAFFGMTAVNILFLLLMFILIATKG